MDVGVRRTLFKQLFASGVGSLREQDRDVLLVPAAVRAERAAEGGEIVLAPAPTQSGVRVGEHDQVADPVVRQR